MTFSIAAKHKKTKQVAAKIFAFVGLGLCLTPIAQARPEISHTITRLQPRFPNSIRGDIHLASPDYQVFAPSTPTSGPDALWKHGNCDNTVRVLVSNIGEGAGSQATITLNVYHPFRHTDTYTRRLASVPANDHVWVEFSDVEFNSTDLTWNYRLEASVDMQGDTNEANNSNSRSSYVTHSCA